jgi:hypothetical protein
MTSDKQIAANRANARKSTGPKTETGKAIVRVNAVKHGGLATTQVLPEIERQDDWDQHLAGTLASLTPVGHLETVMAERIALLLWRLHRVARYEREMIALGQERVVGDVALSRKREISVDKTGPDHPNDLRAALHKAQHTLKVLAQMYRRPDDEPVTGEEAELVLSEIADETNEVNPETFSMPDVVPDDVPWSRFEGWTAGRVRRGVEAMAAAEGDGETVHTLFLAALQTNQTYVNSLKVEYERVQTRLSQLRRERLLASEPQTERVTRYEAHLSRQLTQALNELHRLQAARANAAVAPPVVVDVSVTDDP